MRTRTKTQREQNLTVMEKALIEGHHTADVVQAAMSKFTISERQAWRDLAEIKKRWSAAGEEMRQRHESQCSLAMAVCRRNLLYKKALESGELRSALDAEIDRCKLLDLYPKTKVEVDSRVSVWDKLTEAVDVLRVNEVEQMITAVPPGLPNEGEGARAGVG